MPNPQFAGWTSLSVFVVSRLLPQILFHCKMMAISKADRPVAVVWLLSRSGGESYLGRQLFSAHDVARNTSGSSHCFIREHINNFHWCTNEAEREGGSVTQSLLSLCVCAQTSTSIRKDDFPRIFSGAGGAYVLQHLFCVSKPATESHRLKIRYIYLPSHLCWEKKKKILGF